MVRQIAYTNSKCEDLWEMFITQNRRHCNMPLYMISDKKPDVFGYDDAHIYENSEPYYKVWIDALQKFGEDYFIYLQEDFVLYADVNQEKIDEYVEFLKNNPKYSFVRLLKSGQLYDKKLTDTLYEIESTNLNVFAMQATIWRTADYIRLLDAVRDSKWFETPVYRDKMIALNMSGVYHYNGEERGGKHHHNTRVYPYIATALVRGMWDMGEYGPQLGKLLTEYKVDLNKRGII